MPARANPLLHPPFLTPLTPPGPPPIIACALSQTPPKLASCRFVPAEALRGQRWDPGYWFRVAGPAAWACAPLGDFIEKITYGPIVTGQRPQPAASGVAIIDQKALRPTGVVLGRAVTVAEGSVYDLPRCRLQRDDIVLARSGAGTLAKKRFTVFREPVTATVSCFVDLIRLRGISPRYVATFLRSRPGWAQIERLINGVGTPNLSFDEIRSLQIPLLPAEDQAAVDAAWQEVERLHAAGCLDEAGAALDAAVARLEERIGPEKELAHESRESHEWR